MLAGDPRRTAPETKWAVYELVTNRKLGDVDARPCSALWATYGPQELPAWIKRYPGTRPSCWWRFEGPDGPDGMASCVPPIPRQPRVLKGLGLLTEAESDWRSRPDRPAALPAVRKPNKRLKQLLGE